MGRRRRTPPGLMPRAPFDPATDYYQLLGVATSASAEQIQAAYRRLAKAYHPDLNAGSNIAAARMARVNAAKAVLLDPLTRYAYDQVRRTRSRSAVAPVVGRHPVASHPSRPSAARSPTTSRASVPAPRARR